MNVDSLVEEIKHLSVEDRKLILEKTLATLSEDKTKAMEDAAAMLLDDYKNDYELIAFTDIDFDDFYEAK